MSIQSFRIYIVDDNDEYLLMIKQFIKSLGFDYVATFNNNCSCIEQMSSNPIVIFLDYHMPRADVLEALKHIKRIYPQTRIVFLSGQQNPDVAITALKCGAYDYIEKNANQFTRIEQVLTGLKRENVTGSCMSDGVSNRWFSKPHVQPT